MSEYNLLAVTGMSPQVITETLYALHEQGREMPKNVYIITTAIGKKQAMLTLGTAAKPGEAGKLKQFTQDYNLPDIGFDESNIWVVEDAHGNELGDAATDKDHQLTADFIIDKVRTLTAAGQPTVHASLAGGRKTMTFLLGYAMSLYGRPEDELSHVLVSQGFENLREFFYPTPYDFPLESYDKKMLNAKEAVVTLSDIPFVRLRLDTPNSIIEGKKSYTEVVKQMNLAKQRPSLIIDVAKRTIKCNGIEIKLPPQLLCFYVWIVEHWRDNQHGIVMPTELGDPKYASDFTRIVEWCLDEVKAEDVAEKNFAHGGMLKDFFTTNKSKTNKLIKKALGDSLGRSFMISHINDIDPDNLIEGPSQNGVLVDVEDIEILWDGIEVFKDVITF